jgi:nucleoside recognition membrane protein YjiH
MKLYDLLASLWLDYVGDLLPDYVIVMLNVLAFIFFLLVLFVVPIIFYLVLRFIADVSKGSNRYE